MNIWDLLAIPISFAFFLLSLKRGWWILAVCAGLCCMPIFLNANINEYIRAAIIVYWVALLFHIVSEVFDF